MSATGSQASTAPSEPPLLGHEYDGIREYDNPLPGWWLWILGLSVLLAPFYVLWIHGGPDRSFLDEYRAEAAAVAKRRAEEALRHPVTDESLLTLTKDSASVQFGGNVFATKCVVCHGPEGQGKIGPNLTDTAWILGGSPTRIYETISGGGRLGKGMRAWGKEIGPAELRKVTAFVISLKGTQPKDPKAPEGELTDNTAPPK
ncbi:MAG: c-type cytochrome [Planctomycetes bacterium]|nr:c-type cytochrome [Planctomycetota bacterium]